MLKRGAMHALYNISSDVNRIDCLNDAYNNDKARRATMWEGMRGIKGGEQIIRVHLKLVRLPACRMIDEKERIRL